MMKKAPKKQSKFKRGLENLFLFFVIYCVLNLVPFFFGFADATSSFTRHCDEPRTKLGTILQGYRFGCYMGEPWK